MPLLACTDFGGSAGCFLHSQSLPELRRADVRILRGRERLSTSSEASCCLTRAIANRIPIGRTKGEYVQSSSMPSEATAEDRQRGALLIAASLIAAIRLRGEPITNSPKVVSTISDSITLARMVLQRINGSR